MRRTEASSAFRRDFKRVSANPDHRDIKVLLPHLLDLLTADIPLPAQYRDHALIGPWRDYRECHVKPDLLLIYRKTPGKLHLVRLGSHSTLFKK